MSDGTPNFLEQLCNPTPKPSLPLMRSSLQPFASPSPLSV
jgi:hypothetical protein